MLRLLCVVAVFTWLPYVQEEKKSSDGKPASSTQKKLTSREALARFNVLVGEWRGVGQPKRGSNRGAWSEKSAWRWDFSQKKKPALVLQPQKSKLIQTLRVGFDERSQEYLLSADFTDSKPVEQFRAKPAEKKLVFQQPMPTDEKDRRRVTLQLLSDKRATLLVERGRTSFQRVAGIGYTRKGTSIAGRGSGQPECVVTGGTGTIRVMHKGKTYFVCCTGCRQAFEDDPEGILAEYYAGLEARKNEEKAGPGPADGSKKGSA